METEARPRPVALLIGSGECNQDDGGKLIKRVVRKSGIRRVLKNNQEVPRGLWAKNDLDNMECLLQNKRVDVVKKFNYREQHEDHTFALGREDVIDELYLFFRQRDRTRFILYYSGHGDPDGSWCFPRSFGLPTRAPPSATAAGGATVEVHAAEDVRPRNSSVRNGGAGERQLPPPPIEKTNDFITFEDVIEIWDEVKKELGKPERYLMMIIDCCFSGEWVQKVNGVSDEIVEKYPELETKTKKDISIQASCLPFEKSNVADSQECSVFTKNFVAAQSKSLLEKCILSTIDHALVINLVAIVTDPFRGSVSENRHTPMSSYRAPFDGFKFFDSFDDMYMGT